MMSYRSRSRSCAPATLLALTVLVGAGSTLALSHRAQTSAPLRARNLVDAVDEEYDFVIVGGGLSGLVLGARLTEKSNHKVLVLEAGGTGDADIRERIDTPGDAYYRSLLGTDFNWDFFTEPQERLDGRRVAWPRGRGVGGTTAINGLYMIRPGETEVDAWRDLLGDLDGADKWGWDGLFAAMKKSETFDPPDAELAQRIGLAWNPDSHGTSGPIHRGYPGYIFDQVKLWTDAVAATGAAHSDDTYGGTNWGTCVSMSSINSANWTRSWARAGYLDPLPPRSLYHVVPNAQVARIVWDDTSPADNKKAVGVEYSRDGGRTTSRVTAKTEVILAAGVIGSPTILMHSGVGPRDVLEAAGVPVTIELPGVGQHLQDHMAAAITFTTDQPTAESVRSAGGPEASDPKFLSYINSATSYINLTTLFAGGEENAVGGFADYHVSQYANVSATVPSTDPTVLAGNKALYDLAVEHFRGPIPVVELLLALNSAGVLRITAALQQPLSFGRLYINTTDAFAYPLINANYFASSADMVIMRTSLQFARRVGETAPLNTTLTGETSPGSWVQTDEQWEEWIRGETGSQYHPSSTCAMMPRNMGGVVDAKLRVYGTSNVRVIDGSVPPKSLAAHWMEICYGVAEQGSEIVLAQYGVGEPRPGGTVGDDDAAFTTRPAIVGTALALFATVLAFAF